MKKNVILLLAALFIANIAAAQRHELREGYGMLSSNRLLNRYTEIIPELTHSGKISTGNERSTGVYALSYRYKVLPRTWLGLGMAFERVSKTYSYKNEAPMSMRGRNRFFAVALDLQYTYLQVPSGIVSLYGGLSGGAGFLSQKLGGEIDDTDSVTRFAYQVSPLGITVGLPWIGAFAELGIGYKGLVQLGAYVRF